MKLGVGRIYYEPLGIKIVNVKHGEYALCRMVS
jgi:hypothetical protein